MACRGRLQPLPDGGVANSPQRPWRHTPPDGRHSRLLAAARRTIIGRPDLEFLTPEEFDHLAVRPRDEGDLSAHHLRGHRRDPRNRAGSERTGIGSLNIGDAEAEV